MLSLKEALEEFIFDCEVKGLSKETIKNYSYITKKFLQYVEEQGVLNVEMLDKKLCKRYVIHLQRQGYEESYINTCIRNTNLFFKYLIEEEYIDEPLKMELVKKKTKVIETFTDAEIEKLLKVVKGRKFIDIRNKTLLMLMIDTGLRASEICNLEVKDIKDNNTLFAKGKGKKERYVPFSPALRKQMMKYERARNSYFMDRAYLSNYYFLSRYGKQITRFILQNMVIEIGELAGIDRKKLFPHNFRHYFAVKSLREGLDLYSLSRVLGHSEIQTTTIYASSIRDEEIQELSLKSSPLMAFKGGGR